MRHYKNYSLLFILLFTLQKGYTQQTIQFSQYVFNGLAINPAYAGYKEDLTVNLSFRSQWVGIDGAPRTGTASIDGITNDNNRNVGLGFLATTDRLGPQNTLAVYGNYAYRLRLDDDDTKRLSFGIGAGLTQYALDGSKFNATDQNDNVIPIGSQSKLTPDMRVGIYYSSMRFYAGISALDLLSAAGRDTVTSDSYKIIKQVRHLYLTTGALFTLSPAVDFKPSIMLKEDFKGPTNLDLNASFLINKLIWVGASYRTGVTIWDKQNLQQGLDRNDAVAGIVEIYLSNKLRLGYSYDYSVSKLANYQQGSHELSVSFSFLRKDPRMYCPRYF